MFSNNVEHAAPSWSLGKMTSQDMNLIVILILLIIIIIEFRDDDIAGSSIWILPCRSWRRQRWIYLKSDIFCKISKKFFRPWARHRLSLPVAKATLIADRRQRNCQKLPDPVCFKHFSLFRLSTVFTYLYFWASASSSCLKSVDKELEA